ncbi:hypothetical protein SVIOM342S_07050 [Streptomyces violaceorubidus]
MTCALPVGDSLHAAHTCAPSARDDLSSGPPGGNHQLDITIEAAPADVVIADFARYPDWTGEVKEAQVLATDAQGRAEQVRLVMDAGAIKDDQTLAYTWTGEHEVSWTPSSPRSRRRRWYGRCRRHRARRRPAGHPHPPPGHRPRHPRRRARPAHRPGADPVEPGLTVWRPDAAQGSRDGLAALQDRAASALDLLGAARLDPEDLTPLPGAEDLALLRALREAALAEAHDLLVVDLPARAPRPRPARRARGTAPLSGPPAPPSGRPPAPCAPSSGRLAGVPMPTEALYEAASRWDLELAAAEAVLADRNTVVRLVAEPGPAGADAVRATALGLALRGLRTDCLVANRVLPEDTPADSWLSGPLAQQRKTLEEWRGAHDVRAVAHLGRDPRGPDDLAALDVPGVDPDASPVEWPVTDRLAADKYYRWHIPLPGAVREELDLIRRGDELVVAAGPFRRIVPLPSVLRRCTVDGAALRGRHARRPVRARPAAVAAGTLRRDPLSTGPFG